MGGRAREDESQEVQAVEEIGRIVWTCNVKTERGDALLRPGNKAIPGLCVRGVLELSTHYCRPDKPLRGMVLPFRFLATPMYEQPPCPRTKANFEPREIASHEIKKILRKRENSARAIRTTPLTSARADARHGLEAQEARHAMGKIAREAIAVTLRGELLVVVGLAPCELGNQAWAGPIPQDTRPPISTCLTMDSIRHLPPSSLPPRHSERR